MLADTGDDDVSIFVPDSDFETTKLLLQYIYTGQVLVGLDSDVLESLIYDWVIFFFVEIGFLTLFHIIFLQFSGNWLSRNHICGT